METITDKVQEELRSGAIVASPQLAAEYRARLSGEYSFWAGQLSDILVNKPALWNVHRKDFKSDAACEKWWESTQDGINQTGIEFTLKRISTLMSGLNSIIKLAENESHNNY